MSKLNFSDQHGVRNLYFGTHFIQGAMRLDDPIALEFEYIQQMMLWTLFNENPTNIVQLGLGAGALTKFCHHYYPNAHTSAIELEQAVIDLCHAEFLLPRNNQQLAVVAGDAWSFVSDAMNNASCDVMQIDLYDAQAQRPTLSSSEFYLACARCLKDDGIMVVNVFCDREEHPQHIAAIEHAFNATAWLPEVHDSNIVVIAFKRAPSIDFEQLYLRAKDIELRLNLPAKAWVDGLMQWMQVLH